MMIKVERIVNFLETDTLSFASTDKGLKFLSLRPNRGAKDINLKRFTSEKQEPGSVEEQIINETFGFLETGRHEMPLDLTEFTDFQQRVFEAVSTIELGQVITYKGIAEILGKPGAAQAVGSAVAKNPVSYFLPTHRVLPQRGIGICRSGAGHLREKLLAHEGHDLSTLRGNYVCTRKKCCLE